MVLLFLMIVAGIVTGFLSYFLGGPSIAFFFSNQYKASINYFKILSVFYIPIIPVAMFLNNILVYFEEAKKYLLSTFITLLSILIFYPILIKMYSLDGAVIATIITGFVYTLSSFIFVAISLNNKFRAEMI